MKRRPDVLVGETYKVSTDCGNFFLTLNKANDDLFEVRMEMGKSGNCVRGFLHITSILISEKIQSSDNPKELKKFLRRHIDEFSCGCPFMWRGTNYKSCIDYAAKKILEAIKSEEETKKVEPEQSKPKA